MCRVLSTPHGALGTEEERRKKEEEEKLSTPHGALGTPIEEIEVDEECISAFNSTRCIRNTTSTGEGR